METYIIILIIIYILSIFGAYKRVRYHYLHECANINPTIIDIIIILTPYVNTVMALSFLFINIKHKIKFKINKETNKFFDIPKRNMLYD